MNLLHAANAKPGSARRRAVSPNDFSRDGFSRDGFSRNDWLCCGLLVLLCLLAYAPLIAPVLRGGVPFRDDGISLFWPWRAFARRSLAEGVLPLWNPHSMCGLPFLSNLQTSILYPPNVVYWFLPYGIAAWLDGIFHNVVLCVGAYVFARALKIDGVRLGCAAALLATIGIGLNGGVSSHWSVGHTTWHAARAFIPWELWATLLFLRSGNVRWIVALALLFAAQWAAGYAPLSLLGIALCGGLFVARSVSLFMQSRALGTQSSTRLRAKFGARCGWPAFFGRRVLFGALLCLGLSAVYLLPMLETSRLSARGSESGMSFQMVTWLSGRWPMMVRLLLPQYFGGNVSQWSIVETGAHEQVGFTGILIFILAALAPWMVRRPIARWLWALLPISILLSLGDATPLYRWLFDHVLVFRQVRIPSRWVEVWSLATPLLAALTFETIFVRSDETARQRHLKTLRWALAILLGVLLLWLGATFWTPDEVWRERMRWAQPSIFPTVKASEIPILVNDFRVTALITTLGAIIVTWMAFLLLSRKIVRRDGDKAEDAAAFATRSVARHWNVVRVGVIGLATFEMMVLFWQTSAPVPAAAFAKGATLDATLTSRWQSDERWHIGGGIYNSNSFLVLGRDSFDGYDALMDERYFALADAVEKTPIWNAWLPMSGNPSPLFRVAGVSHLLSPSPPTKRSFGARNFALVAQHKKWKLWRYAPIWPRFYLSRNIVRAENTDQLQRLKQLATGDFKGKNQPVVVAPEVFSQIAALPLDAQDRVLDWSRTLNSVTVETQSSHESVLVQSDTLYPGWRAWTNGVPTKVELANFMFRGVVVPAGRARTVLVYDTQTFRFALFVSLCALSFFAAWFVAQRKPNR